ncbi:agmatinase [Sorangium cellulosum]|uniref:Agmatinase n=1 Tax=Sorangium cellulosum TaxID=56 RepID=A0A4P2PVZ6_SORCE|nr:agmatinase [Sorangium cellulosum]AUX20840.1 agmatinase [Sorangium cellulosum]
MANNTGDHAFTARSLNTVPSEPMYSGALSFLRRRYTRDLSGVDVAVTGLPLDTATSNRPGARFGPRAVREASALLTWDRPYGCEFNPLERLAVADYGDCVWDYGRPLEAPAAIEAHIAGILRGGAAPLSLGGDHFISLPVLRALHEQHGTLSLLHFDAHSDTWSREDEQGRIDHGSMFFVAAREGLVDPGRSVQVGIRTENPDTHGFQILDAPWIHRNGAAAVIQRIREVIGGHRVYVTFDIDCLDPAFAPGTGTPVCGGISTATAIEILRGIAGLDVVGMDVVEVAPAYDAAGITALAAATLAYELLILYASAPRRRAAPAQAP